MPDERLMTVAGLVRPGSRVADIGTDHAYLPVYLVGAGICPSAIASDLREGPLEAARRHIDEAGLTGRIAVRLGDGLACVSPDEVEDVVIAGMGGETIVGILQAAPWVRDGDKRLICQPMTHAEDLRRYLLYHGFSLETERLVIDGRHLYPVMAARFTDAPPPADDRLVYAGAFADAEGAPYRRQMAHHLRRRAEGARHAGDTESAATWTALAEQIEK